MKWLRSFKCSSIIIKREFSDLINYPIQINSYNNFIPRLDPGLLKKKLCDDIQSNSKKYLNLIDSNSINQFPIFITQDQLEEFKKIHDAIYHGIKSVVNNYGKDEQIQKTFNFPEKIKRILQIFDGINYENIGTFRPDFIHEKDTRKIKICEINARFPLNGYLTTLFALRETNNNQYISLLRNLTDNQIDAVDFNFDLFNKISDYFDLSKPIAIVKEKEVN
jgi:hypothetical protein